MYGVTEAVALVDAVTEGSQGTKHTQAVGGKERKRASRRTGNDGAVDVTERGWAAPGQVAVFRIRCRDAPVVFVVADLEVKTEGLVGAGCGDGVGEVVGVAIAFGAEVVPGVGVLVDKQWVDGADVFECLERHARAREVVPKRGRNGMRG